MSNDAMETRSTTRQMCTALDTCKCCRAPISSCASWEASVYPFRPAGPVIHGTPIGRPVGLRRRSCLYDTDGSSWSPTTRILDTTMRLKLDLFCAACGKIFLSTTRPCLRRRHQAILLLWFLFVENASEARRTRALTADAVVSRKLVQFTSSLLLTTGLTHFTCLRLSLTDQQILRITLAAQSW